MIYSDEREEKVKTSACFDAEPYMQSGWYGTEEGFPFLDKSNCSANLGWRCRVPHSEVNGKGKMRLVYKRLPQLALPHCYQVTRAKY